MKTDDIREELKQVLQKIDNNPNMVRFAIVAAVEDDRVALQRFIKNEIRTELGEIDLPYVIASAMDDEEQVSKEVENVLISSLIVYFLRHPEKKKEFYDNANSYGPCTDQNLTPWCCG